ncbi:MAG: hypothetical protein K9M54_06260 [Kiritimatiellales bacterium]|nr:hypothetical protein [Kiritimatiellales bacterium]MCF7863290.1 hypothetical protein [Kiritimatiellales bacterium]
MDKLQADRVVKAIVDGVDSFAEIAAQSGLEPFELVEYQDEVERAISLMRGFYKFGHENMQPAGLPPPKNPYYDAGKAIDGQSPEYYAFEAVQRGSIDRDRCVWTCGQFGLDPEAAEAAIDNVIMPWRAANGWRSYVRVEPDGRYVLQDKPPVKLKRHLDRLLETLAKPRG